MLVSFHNGKETLNASTVQTAATVGTIPVHEAGYNHSETSLETLSSKTFPKIRPLRLLLTDSTDNRITFAGVEVICRRKTNKSGEGFSFVCYNGAILSSVYLLTDM